MTINLALFSLGWLHFWTMYFGYNWEASCPEEIAADWIGVAIALMAFFNMHLMRFL